MNKLSIVIPVYNEESAIGSVIEKILVEKKNIIEKTNLTDVEIIVVDDGSKDRTHEIVKTYKGILLITHTKNKGYGAALKTGFKRASGDIIGFLDADGTYDPRYFVDLCNKLLNQKADMVIGSRMVQKNEMPLIRKIGNKMFTSLINLISGSSITDCASGIRVIQKEALKTLYPLPDGLHFTPAMTSKTVIEGELKVSEVPIAYYKRTGKSKLGIVRDGVTFLKTIFDISLIYKPLIFFASVGLMFIAIALGYGIYPILNYLKMRVVEEWMIYRLITILVLVIVGLNMLTIGIISEEAVAVLDNKKRRKNLFVRVCNKIFSQKNLFGLGLVLILLGIGINYRTIFQFITTGMITVHWSRVVTGGFFILCGFQMLALGLLERIISMISSLVSQKLFIR